MQCERKKLFLEEKRYKSMPLNLIKVLAKNILNICDILTAQDFIAHTMESVVASDKYESSSSLKKRRLRISRSLRSQTSFGN